MSVRFAIIAALPREIAGLVRGRKADEGLRRRGIFRYQWNGVIVVAAGMGAARVALAVEAALAMGSVTELISVGLAGACIAELLPGAVVEATVVVDTQTGERIETSSNGPGGERKVVLASAPDIASVGEKRRLAAAYDAVAVDMEAATVGRLARAHGVGFRAIKAVSDDAETELGELGRFATADGQFRTGAFALHTALRPHTWGQTMRLGRDSKAALEALTKVLEREIAS